jgi:aminoglycoside 2''-phosphotransferase
MRVTDRKIFIKKIKTHFPEVDVDNPKLITHGWDNDVVVLNNKLIFRFPRTDEYKKRFKAEVKLLKYLISKVSVPIPQYTYLSDDLSFGGYRMIQGVNLSSDVFKVLSDEKREDIAKQLGQFLSVMHETPIKFAQECGFKEEEEGYWWNEKHTKKVLENVREKVFPQLEKYEIDWIEYQFAKYLSLSFDFDTAVIHSDFTEEHIFIDPEKGRVTGIIDFSDTEFSDPALDFTGMWRYGEQFAKQVMKYYSCNKDPNFLERSKFPSLVHMVGNMLELAEGKNLPITFESSRKELTEVMESELTL